MKLILHAHRYERLYYISVGGLQVVLNIITVINFVKLNKYMGKINCDM